MKIGVDIIQHQWFQKIIEEIDDLRETGYLAANAETQMLRGPSRVGKSVLIRQYRDANPPNETEDGWVRPVVLIEAPGKGTMKALAEALLTELGDEQPSRGTATAMMTRAKHHLKEQKTELIIIDEVQDAMHGDLYSDGDFFKFISNWDLCPILLVGLPHAIDLLYSNEQLRFRCRELIDLRPFDWFSDRELFLQIVATFEAMIPKDITCIPLSDEPIAMRLNYGTWGTIGLLTRLLRSAERLARKNPERTITLEVLGDAYENLQTQEPHDVRRKNPFKLKQLPEQWSSLPPGGNVAAQKNRRRHIGSAGIGAE